VKSIALDATLKQIEHLQAEALDAQGRFVFAAREARDAAQRLQDSAARYARVYDRLQTFLCDALTEASEALIAADPNLAPKLNQQIAELQELVASRVRIEHIVDLNTSPTTE